MTAPSRSASSLARNSAPLPYFTRVADLVLLTNNFATVPRAIEEGRRILRDTHRLFVIKTTYAAFLVARDRRRRR